MAEHWAELHVTRISMGQSDLKRALLNFARQTKADIDGDIQIETYDLETDDLVFTITRDAK